jgi:hypothetical protein
VLDDRDASSNLALAWGLTFSRQPESAVNAARRAIALNPSFAHAYVGRDHAVTAAYFASATASTYIPPMPDLFLRKVPSPHAPDAHRVILKTDEGEIEIGSIGVTHFTGTRSVWTWAIDTVVPMWSKETEGAGTDLKDAMRRFKAAWERFSADPATLTAFLEAKRRARRASPA